VPSETHREREREREKEKYTPYISIYIHTHHADGASCHGDIHTHTRTGPMRRHVVPSETQRNRGTETERDTRTQHT